MRLVATGSEVAVLSAVPEGLAPYPFSLWVAVTDSFPHCRIGYVAIILPHLSWLSTGFFCFFSALLCRTIYPPFPRIYLEKRRILCYDGHIKICHSGHTGVQKGQKDMIDFENGTIFKLTPDNGRGTRLVEDLLIPGETVIGSYSVVRDFVVFTDKRIISCNIQGVTGKKRDFTSMPYSKISVFSIETSGILDMDSELELYFSGVGRVHFDFSGGTDIRVIGQAIGQYILQ